jgi:hypothetical protein
LSDLTFRNERVRKVRLENLKVSMNTFTRVGRNLPTKANMSLAFYFNML